MVWLEAAEMEHFSTTGVTDIGGTTCAQGDDLKAKAPYHRKDFLGLHMLRA